MNDIISVEHMKSVMKFRRLYTLLKENETLIRIGAYTKGTDSELDEAIEKKIAMEEFITQDARAEESFEDTVEAIVNLMAS
jgi:flagellum-specific ATP synthase